MTERTSDLPEWGLRLSEPSDLGSEKIRLLFKLAYEATEEQQRGAITIIEARQARVAAHILPPKGYLFAYPLQPDTVVQRHALYRAGHHVAPLRVSVSPDVGTTVLGNRVNFPYDLSGENGAAAAQLYCVEANGEETQPRQKVLLPDFDAVLSLGFVAIEPA